MLLRSWESGISAIQNKRGDRESPWKIPHLIRMPFEIRIPFTWLRVRFVSHNIMLVRRKLIKTGETLKISTDFKIQECRTLSNIIIIIIIIVVKIVSVTFS